MKLFGFYKVEPLALRPWQKE